MLARAVTASPSPVASCRRRVGASLERVVENVLDWEHLPWLHRASFSSIELQHADDSGWRAAVGLQPEARGRRVEIEVRFAAVRECYVTRTLGGAGEGTEIWTRLDPRAEHETAIEVEFRVPGVAGDARVALGKAYVALYERLWDEDEAMMRRREAELRALRERPRGAGERLAAVALGPLAELRARLPLVVESGGRSYRVVELDGDLVAHATVCPHKLGPLEGCAIEDGALRCPWHGHRFDVRTGESCDGRRLRLPPAPRVELGPGAQVQLTWETSRPGCGGVLE
jgi:nitrite reductase/ring-hydroxylating ferredoxin subunit